MTEPRGIWLNYEYMMNARSATPNKAPTMLRLRISLNTDSDFIKSRVAISLKCGQFLASRFQACPLIIVSCFRD